MLVCDSVSGTGLDVLNELEPVHSMRYWEMGM
jgi:hypothetical protein